MKDGLSWVPRGTPRREPRTSGGGMKICVTGGAGVIGSHLVDRLVRDGHDGVVFASSSSVYGDQPTLPKTETMTLEPRSPYAASKAAGEAYLAACQASYGLEGVSLRYFNVYGPRQSPRSLYAAVVPRFVEAMAA